MRSVHRMCEAALIALTLLTADLLAQAPVEVTSPTFIEVPPPQQEIITTAPSPATVWVPGAWERTPDRWIWKDGQWVKPPFGRAYWVAGYWQHAGGRYRWSAGHWAAGTAGAVVAQKVAAPAPLVETQPVAPVGLQNPSWVPGRWEWRGTWVWVPGHYVAASNPQAVWVQGAWDASLDGSWRWNPAHWAIN